MRKRRKQIRQADDVVKREVAAIKAIRKRAEANAKQLVRDAADIGRRLARVKSRVGHNNWQPWLEKNFGWSEDTAQRYMRTAKFVTKNRTLRFLDLSAIYALSARNVPEDVVQQIAHRVESGEKPRTRVITAEVRNAKQRVTSVEAATIDAPSSLFHPGSRAR